MTITCRTISCGCLLLALLIALPVMVAAPQVALAREDSQPLQPLRRPRNDHEVARRALSKGEIRPLDSVIADVRQAVPGDIVGVELDKLNGRWTYRFKVITPGGRMKRVQVDAKAAFGVPPVVNDPAPVTRGARRGFPTPPAGVGREPPAAVKSAPAPKPAKPVAP